VVSLTLAVSGIAALVLGLRACDAGAPTRFGPYVIAARIEGEAKYFDLVRDGKVEHTLAGSLDTLCEPPFVALFDVDGDGTSDLYFENCRGHGYLVQRAGALSYVEEGDGPAPDGWWARQVLGGGRRLIAIAVLLCFVALIGLAIAGARLRAT
jgi:hypothetical protein